MIICPECGEENPQGSKFCRKCGINLVHEEPEIKKERINAEKVTVEINEEPVRRTTINTNSSPNTKKNNDNSWCWGCCICMIFLFIIFAIFGH